MPPPYLTIIAVVAAFALAAVVARGAHAFVHRRLDVLATGNAERRAAMHARAQQLVRMLTLLAYGVAALASISFALPRLGVGALQWDPRTVGGWLITHGVNVLLIAVGAVIVLRAANLAIEHLQHRLADRHAQTDLEWQRRASTLRGILTNFVTVAVGFVAVLMLLRELSIDVLPILTTAGVAGLAIGFGAQNLVRDVISGFFVILEDQVRVGDLARINGVTGVVEEINLRTIVARDGEGAVHVFPNGTINALANLSKQFSYAVVDARVTYRADIDGVLEALREVGASMEHDPTWGSIVLAPIEILGIESIAGEFVTVRVKFKTRPFAHDRVASELRRRVVRTLAERGIQPYAGGTPLSASGRTSGS